MSIVRRKALLNNAENLPHDCIARLGGVKHAWCKVSDLIVSSLEVYKFSSLEGFMCWLGKVDLRPLQWGGRSCVIIANYRFGEGVHPVRVNTRHCFTTFAMTVICHSEGVFYPTYQLVLTLPIEVHLTLRRASLLMLRGFFAPLCSALNDKTLTNFFNFTFKLAFNLPANIFTPSTFQPFNCSTLREVVRHA